MRRSAPPNMQAKHPRSVGDAIGDLAAFDDPHTLVMRGIGDPDAARFVEADAVGRDAIEVGPYPTVRQRAVRGDVERGEATAEGLTHDERGSVGRDHGAVREHQVVRRCRHRAVRGDQRERRRLRCFAVGEVVPEVADVGAPRAVDDHVVAVEGRDTTQVGVLDEAARVEPHETAVLHRHDEQPAIGQPPQP